MPAGVRAGEGGEPGALATLEVKQLDERGTAVEGLVLGDRARRRAGGRVAELRGLGKAASGAARCGRSDPNRPRAGLMTTYPKSASGLTSSTSTSRMSPGSAPSM